MDNFLTFWNEPSLRYFFLTKISSFYDALLLDFAVVAVRRWFYAASDIRFSKRTSFMEENHYLADLVNLVV